MVEEKSEREKKLLILKIKDLKEGERGKKRKVWIKGKIEWEREKEWKRDKVSFIVGEKFYFQASPTLKWKWKVKGLRC